MSACDATGHRDSRRADTASADATFFFRVRGERMSLEIATREPTEPTLHELAALVLDRPRFRESRFRD